MRIPHLAADYSPEYETLLRAASSHGAKPITLPFTSPSQTLAVRAKLYAYFRALRTEGLRPDLAHLTKLITVTLGEQKLSLTLSLCSQDFDNEAIRLALDLPRTGRAALPLLPLAPAPQKPNDLSKRLANIRAEKAAAKANR